MFTPACRGWEGRGSNRLSSFLGLLQQVIFGRIHLTSSILMGSPCILTTTLGIPHHERGGAGMMAVTFLQPTFVTAAG